MIEKAYAFQVLPHHSSRLDAYAINDQPWSGAIRAGAVKLDLRRFVILLDHVDVALA